MWGLWWAVWGLCLWKNPELSLCVAVCCWPPCLYAAHDWEFVFIAQATATVTAGINRI